MGEIVTRQAWGGRPSVEESNSLPDNLPMLFVHHSAMQECGDRESCSKAVRDIQDLHMEGMDGGTLDTVFLSVATAQFTKGVGSISRELTLKDSMTKATGSASWATSWTITPP